jgi:hypothetical protein
VTLVDLVAVRLVITTVLWPEVRHKKSNCKLSAVQNGLIKKMESLEKKYSQSLLEKLLSPVVSEQASPSVRSDAQLVLKH